MATTDNDDGVRWIIHRGPRFDATAAARGVLAPGGEYWHGTHLDGGGASPWGPATGARYYTTAERDDIEATGGLWDGGQWVQVFTAVTA